MDLRSLVLSFPEATEKPHFEKSSFRVRNKIFVTINQNGTKAVLKLSEIDQDVYCKMSHGAMVPVANKWGKKGWTEVNIGQINKQLLTDALKAAYCEVAPKKLSERVE